MQTATMNDKLIPTTPSFCRELGNIDILGIVTGSERLKTIRVTNRGHQSSSRSDCMPRNMRGVRRAQANYRLLQSQGSKCHVNKEGWLQRSNVYVLALITPSEKKATTKKEKNVANKIDIHRMRKILPSLYLSLSVSLPLSLPDVSITQPWWSAVVSKLESQSSLSWKPLLKSRDCQLQFGFVDCHSNDKGGNGCPEGAATNERWSQLKTQSAGPLQCN